ncbi:serine/threonine-protein phosphatase 7 long form homolog [Arachis ipaensis]|uniref:serine/threonine-protein phosphatase 7 long form homolog n=1 Tax=Arachis ipaensis TaxID=130454 RepID=UPI0007AFD40D|nr:serine/threonine-protein phosphatase 7 long form homolog [Arachis ipaensis]XP_025633655.1 serine/threonine-protein phosphatase 7 long form homolog [Arachis hypogaea]QHO24665.1 uncharacterized protein DS421_12g374180 [Arachis hypogaea]
MEKRDITRADEHISEYLQHPIYGSRNLHSRHLHQIDSYDARVEEQLRESGFYHISQIGRIMSHGPTIDALVERWRLEMHTFHLPHGEYTTTLEDVAMIFGLRTHGLPITGSTDHSTNGLENECMTQFGIAPGPNDYRGSGVKLAWFRTLKRRQHLNGAVSREIYVKCHIMCLFGTTLFSDKSGISVHWKYLSLLRDFSQIHKFNWGSACLAHMYRSLCRASRYDCKDIDGPMSLLLVWA